MIGEKDIEAIKESLPSKNLHGNVLTASCPKCGKMFALDDNTVSAKGWIMEDTVDVVILCDNPKCDFAEALGDVGKVLT